MVNNVKKLRVVTIVGTRPEIIRLSRVLSALDSSCEHYLIHTGQNYDFELNQIFFDELGLKKPYAVLDCASQSKTIAETIGKIIAQTYDVLKKISPDAVLVLGDTNSSLAAISAKRLKIPIFHMEAGNRCFDARVPEEINRKIVDHIADINLTYSSIAREYLLREGIAPDRVIKTGSPMKEVLDFYEPQIRSAEVHNFLGIEKGQYFLVSAHREENIENGNNFKKLYEILNSVASDYCLPVIVSTHPRTQKKINSSKLSFNPNIKFLKPLGFIDYVALQLHSTAVLSDSGTITEESSILGFPALNLRETHERPEGMEEAAVMMVGLNTKRVLQGLRLLEDLKNFNRSKLNVQDYSIDNVSIKIVKIIHSYVDYIATNTWKNI